MSKKMKGVILLISVAFLVILLNFNQNAIAESGCCSWHKGVSHCDLCTGRQVCNDNTFSPSCTCEKDITQCSPPQTSSSCYAQNKAFREKNGSLKSENENLENNNTTQSQELQKTQKEKDSLKDQLQQLQTSFNSLNDKYSNLFIAIFLVGVFAIGTIIWAIRKK